MSQQLSTREKPEACSAERVLVPKICVTLSAKHTQECVLLLDLFFRFDRVQEIQIAPPNINYYGRVYLCNKILHVLVCSSNAEMLSWPHFRIWNCIDMYTKNSTSLSRHVLRNTILICLFYTTLIFQRLETSLRTMNN